MTRFYLYRRGNGNDGSYPRAMVILQAGDNPCTALHALLLNDWQEKSSTREYISDHVDMDSDGVDAHGVVYEGPNGETEFGAAWLTCELEPYTEAEAARHHMTARPLREILDAAALAMFNKDST